jgi:phosphonate transport system substrate-binding protein
MRPFVVAPLFAPVTSFATFILPSTAHAGPNRGALDAMYCDENGDLVADAPKDRARWKDPDTLVFTCAPVEDPGVYRKLFEPFMEHLSQATGKKVVYFSVQSNAAEIETMRSGRLHIAGFSTGPTMYAVNLAGAVPFACRGFSDRFEPTHLWVIVKSTSDIKTLTDLKGKKSRARDSAINVFHWREAAAVLVAIAVVVLAAETVVTFLRKRII